MSPQYFFCLNCCTLFCNLSYTAQLNDDFRLCHLECLTWPSIRKAVKLEKMVNRFKLKAIKFKLNNN